MKRMTSETYEKLTVPFRKWKKWPQLFILINKILTAITYVSYIVLVVICLVAFREKFWQVLLVPAFGFGFVTIFRKKFNASRPYEKLDIQPLLVRHKDGQSFPSRHSFSIFMIAMAIGYVWLPGQFLFFALGVLLAAIRVIGGVHFLRDVAAGAGLGILFGMVGFWLPMLF